MSIAAASDLMVHLSRVQNIDCFGCGFYHVKVEAFCTADGSFGREKVERVSPTYIPPKPFVEQRREGFLEAHIDSLNSVYVSQSFYFRNHVDEVELNDIVLFRFTRPFRDQPLSRYLRFSIWQAPPALHAAASFPPQLGQFTLVCSKVFGLSSPHCSFHQALPVFFEPHRTCVLHASVTTVALSFAIERDAPGLQQLERLTEGFSAALLDRLYALLNRRLFRSVKLVCARICALLTHFHLNRERLWGDLILQQFPFQQESAAQRLAAIERGNRPVRDRLAREALVG